MNNGRILFYDSGLGGLSTLKAAMKLAPNEQYLYFADDANCPYGERTSEEINRLVRANLDKICAAYPIKMVVLACNTVTACCIDSLRREMKMTFVGTEPAVSLAQSRYGGKILVCATRATLEQPRVKRLCAAGRAGVISLPLHDLAGKIERGLDGGEVDLSPEIDQMRAVVKSEGIKSVVLGCTHYCFVEKRLSEALGVSCVDGNEGVARRIRRLLGELGEGGRSGLEILLSSGDSARREKYRKILCRI